MHFEQIVMGPVAWYKQACEKAGFVCDAAQTAAIEELEVLWHQLVEFKHKRNKFLGRTLLSPSVPKGLYLWGGVGRGKTFLMDGFFQCLPYRRKRRIHFHYFMAEIHHEMKKLSHERDPLMALADNIAQATRVLCLDELHVDDITDAMILGRLLAALFARGVVLLTSSNYAPDGLYPNGLQRKNFLPAIELLKHELKILHFDGKKDYRMLHMVRDPVYMLSEEGSEPMASLFDYLADKTDAGFIAAGSAKISVVRAAEGVVWFDFKALCGGNYDQTEYIAIAHRYHTIFLSEIPRMTPDNAACARRFTWLIDVLYDNHVKLVASFDVVHANLYVADSSESQRITSRLTEMQTHRYLAEPHKRAKSHQGESPSAKKSGAI